MRITRTGRIIGLSILAITFLALGIIGYSVFTGPARVAFSGIAFSFYGATITFLIICINNEKE